MRFRDRGGAEALQPAGAFDPIALFAGGVGGMVKGTAIDASELLLTSKVAQNLASRPYLNSSLLIREIMNAGRSIRDPGNMAGALRWDVAGTFNGSEGFYELVVHPTSRRIVHFLFTSAK